MSSSSSEKKEEEEEEEIKKLKLIQTNHGNHTKKKGYYTGNGYFLFKRKTAFTVKFKELENNITWIGWGDLSISHVSTNCITLYVQRSDLFQGDLTGTILKNILNYEKGKRISIMVKNKNIVVYYKKKKYFYYKGYKLPKQFYCCVYSGSSKEVFKVTSLNK
jgi:hypothetical protein